MILKYTNKTNENDRHYYIRSTDISNILQTALSNSIDLHFHKMYMLLTDLTYSNKLLMQRICQCNNYI